MYRRAWIFFFSGLWSILFELPALVTGKLCITIAIACIHASCCKVGSPLACIHASCPNLGHTV